MLVLYGGTLNRFLFQDLLIESPNSCVSHPSIKLFFGDYEDEDSYISFPYSSIETSPNWGRTMDNCDEEIAAMFDLRLNLPDDDLFPSYDEEDYDGEDDATVYDVKGPFSRM